jgi:class 3 adenylate cyclase
MTFEEILNQAIALLQRQGRVSYRALKRQFDLDEAYVEDLKLELIEVHQVAVDQDNTMMVWIGGAATSPPAAANAVSVQARAPDTAPLTYTPPHLTDKILAARPALAGERKQVPVLFADLKDSTELIRGLDPEAAQQLLDLALHHMMDAVHRFEGTVNQVLGDGIMALFGAPIAHEDHALRACYAALAMQAAMQPYTEEVRRTRGLELRMRVGLNSGEVVVRAIGNDLHMDYSAVGETTVLAARMEQTATPGTIRLPAATLRLVEGLVQVTALGSVPVKGLADPVEVYELTGASLLRRRLRPPRPAGSPALSGDSPSSRPCGRRDSGPPQGMARWWPWWVKRGWASPAWSMSASMPRTRRVGACWRAPRCPTAKPRPTSPSSTCSGAMPRSRTRTIPAPGGLGSRGRC